MVTHSSILAGKISWTEEPGGLWSMGSQSQTQLKQLSMHACQAVCVRSACHRETKPVHREKTPHTGTTGPTHHNEDPAQPNVP